MNLYIDNNDGQGGVDYTSALLAERPLTIVRERGVWTRCCGGLDVIGNGLPLPASRARVLVTDASNAVLFQGFLANDSAGISAAASTPVAEESPHFFAFEAAWLTQEAPSKELAPPTAAVHSVALGDIALSFDTTSGSASSALATDVTVSGAIEASTYVTELFRGDGTTQTFALAHAPFRASGSETLLSESFDGASLNATVWLKVDPGNYLTLSSGGLHIGGGTGFIDKTVLQGVRPVEMGGTLVANATGVILATGSDGVLIGFYNGLVQHSLCIAGVRVLGAGGAQELVAIVNGVEQAKTYSFVGGHAYSVRVRVHSPEVVRVPETYSVLVDGSLQQFGAEPVTAPLHVVIEVVDSGLTSSTLPTVLFNGTLATSPTQCLFAPVNSTSIVGSLAAVELLQQGSSWVVSTATDGTVAARREGATGTGADFTLSSTGVMTFAPGRVPQPGELITVNYRRSSRAVARLRDAIADEVSTSLALPGLPTWSGHVIKPIARSSADCTAAVRALLALANGSATGKSGYVEWVREVAVKADVQPGDTISVTTAAAPLLLPVQSVTVTDAHCVPEMLRYRAECAQTCAASMDFAIGSSIPADVLQPIAATSDVTNLPASLSGLQVMSATGVALAVDAGVDPPGGGGFEVRRSEANFGVTNTTDLVLISPVRSFSIPRMAFAERFFVRMYDASTPRKYSPLSSVVLTSLPTS